MSNNQAKKVLPVLLLALGLILIAVSGYFMFQDVSTQNDATAIPVQMNVPAPELTLTDIDGTTRSLGDYQGQVVLVNLWATWCPPCKAEMPTLEAYYDKYKDKDFTIIAINDGDPTPDVVQFTKDFKLTFPVWLDPTYIATEDAFKTLNLPSSFVIDKNGVIRLQWVGEISRKTLENFVTPIIKEN